MPNVRFEMTGAAIVRWQAGGTVVLAVHGSFDGASAWALRLAMEESEVTRFVVDLTHAEEAFEFAASILAVFAQQNRRNKRISFLPGRPEHARLLTGFGLEVLEDEVAADLPLPTPSWSPEVEPGATA